MPQKATMALLALFVACFHLVVLADAGNRASNHGALVRRPASMSNGPTAAVDDAARSFTAGGKGAFAASPLAWGARFDRGDNAASTKRWIKLTAPGGGPVHINVEQIASVRHDTEMPGANTQIDLANGKFQRVQEYVDDVMWLISATSDASGE